jgi:hypothetical protein
MRLMNGDPPTDERTTRYAFPTLFVLSQDKTRPIWSAALRLDSDPLVIAVWDLVQDELEPRFDPSLGGVVELAAAFLSDVLALKRGTAGAERLACDYLQLAVAVDVARNAVAQGQLGLAHDWIIHACVDALPYPDEVEFPPHRFLDLVSSPRPDLSSASEPLFFEWLGLLFYYSRVRGALRGHAENFLPIAATVVGMLLRHERHTEAVVIAEQMLCWAAVNNRDEAGEVAAAVERLYQQDLPPRLRKRVGMIFTTMAARWTGRPATEWAREVLRSHRSLLEGHEEVALLAASVATVEDAESLKADLLEAIRAYRCSISPPSSRRALLLRYTESRLFKILDPVIFLLSRSFRAGYIKELFGAWYDIPVGEQRASSPVCCVPFHGDGTLLFVDGDGVVVPQSADTGVRVVDATNRFLGTKITIAENPVLDEYVPPNPGFPMEVCGPAFEAAVKELYLGEGKARDWLRAAVGRGDGLLVVSGAQHPLQPLFLAEAGIGWPLVASFQRPHPDRRVRRVGVWRGGSFYDEIEAQAIRLRLEQHGVDVDLIEIGGDAVESFRRSYCSHDYDVFWVIAHGHYDHWDPHRAYIQLSANAGDRIYLEELVTLPVPTGARRLLVLDICDGGTAATFAGAPRLGIGPVLAGPDQAAVSHLWPVFQLSLAAFGAFLAVGLTKHQDFWSAFRYAVTRMNAPKAEIEEALRGDLPGECDLPERFHNRSVDSENVYHWGSPVFYE